MSPLGSVEDRCMGYDLLQLIVNRQSPCNTKLKKKKKKSNKGPQSLSHAASHPQLKDLMLVRGQTSGSQSPHLVAPSCKERGATVPLALPVAPVARGKVMGHTWLTATAVPKLPTAEKGRNLLRM